MAVLLGVHDHGHGAQLRSGLSTLPGLPRPWTALRSRLRGPAAHSRLDAGEQMPAPTAPWKTGQRMPVSHIANRPFTSQSTCLDERI